MATYHNGSDGKVYFKPSTSTSFIEAAVTKWDLTIKSNPKDVSNSKDGRKRIVGVQDAEGNASLHIDTANLPSDQTANTGLNLRAGTVFQSDFVEDGGASGGTDAFRGSFIIDEVHASSEFEGTIDYEVKFSLESGTVKYPGDA